MGRWLALLLASASFVACTDAVPEMGLLSKSTSLKIRLDDEAHHQGQILVRRNDLHLIVEGTEPYTHFAAGEADSCENLEWQERKAAYPIFLSAGLGSKTIHYRYKNGAGEFDCQKYEVILKESNPVLTSFEITGDILESSTIYVGAQRKLSLDLTQASLVSEMKISQDASCLGGNWQDYVSTLANFSVSSVEGPQSLSVSMRDVFGATTVCLVRNYVLDTTGPDLLSWSSSLNPTPPFQVDRTASPPFSWNQNPTDAGIGFDKIQVSVGTSLTNQSISPWTDVVGMGGQVTGLNLVAGTYYLNFRAFDRLGNSVTGVSREFKVFPVAPTLGLENPLSSPGTVTNVRLFVGSTLAGQVINIFDNNTCTGAVTATGYAASSSLIIPISSVTIDGAYTFFAQTVENGLASGCSATSVQYTLDRMPPTLTVVRTGPTTGTQATEFTWSIQASGATLFPLGVAAITPVGPGSSGCTEAIRTLAGVHTFEYSLTGCTGFGSVGFIINAGVALDTAGNGSASFTTSAQSAQLTNSIRIEFASSGDIVSEGTVVTNESINIVSSGTSSENLRVWYEPLWGSPHFHSVESAWLNILPNFVDIPAGQTSAQILYSYSGSSISKGSQTVQFAITAITSANTSSLNSITGTHAVLGKNQIFRRLIKASNGSTEILSVAMGEDHSCLITPQNKIKCWGVNSIGEIPGAIGSYSKPVFWDLASGLDYQSVIVGLHFTCGLTMTGYLRCSGSNLQGQFADGTTVATSTVVDAGFMTSVTRLQFLTVSAGPNGVCGIQVGTQQLFCWGENTLGASGIPGGAPVLYANNIAPGSAFVGVARGGQHACGILQAGQIRCWGDGTYGQIGTFNTAGTVSLIDPDTAGHVSFKKIAAGTSTTCAIDLNNVLKCWGRYISAAGDFFTGYTTQARAVAPTQQFLDITIGEDHFCGIRLLSGGAADSGEAYCYGYYTHGQLGIGFQEPQYLQAGRRVNTSRNFKSIVAAKFKTCGVDADLILSCWGTRLGILGDGGRKILTLPQVVDAQTNYSQIANGWALSCGITTDQNLKCWGGNATVVGDGSLSERNFPVLVDPGVRYKKVKVGLSVACGITVEDRLKCWGRNQFSQMGTNTTAVVTVPTIFDGSVLYRDISVGDRHVCGVTDQQDLKCWGHNSSGQLGDGTTMTRTSPVVIDSGVKYKMVSTGVSHTCGITVLDRIKCWGRNSTGQLANGLTTDSLIPTAVLGSTTYAKVSAGSNSTCALSLSGQVFCSGELAGTLDFELIPSFTNPIDLSLGSDHLCVANHSGAAQCFGGNAHGQLGQGNQQVYTEIRTISGFNIKQTAAYEATTCAISELDKVSCWGTQVFGSLGDGQVESSSPVAIAP